MGELGHLNLNRLAGDTGSFLARVLVAGSECERLPPGFEGALLAFLRIHATTHAKRHRTGIAVDRDGLDTGVRMGFTCVEAGLEHAAQGDLERAIELLAAGGFEELRRQGWECTWNVLDHMRSASADLLRSPLLPLLAQWQPDLERWATIVPESWTVDGDADNAERLNPIVEYRAFLPVSERSRFLDSLPGEAIQPLLDKWSPGTDFSLFLRQLIAALALGRLRLPLGPAVIERFTSECFDDSGLTADAHAAVLQPLQDHLRSDRSISGPGSPSLYMSTDRSTILQEVQEQIRELERSDPSSRADLLRLPRWR